MNKTSTEEKENYLNKEFYMLIDLQSKYPPSAYKIKLSPSAITSIAYSIYLLHERCSKGNILINEFNRLLMHNDSIPHDVNQIFISIDNYELYKKIHTKLFQSYKNNAIIEIKRELDEVQSKQIQLLPE